PVLVTDAANGTVLQNRRADALFATSDANNEGRRRAVEINNLLLGSFLTRSAAPDPAAAGRELNLVDPSEGADLLFEVLSTPVPASFDGEGVTLAILRDITDLKRAITQMEHQFQRERQARALSRREQDRLNLILENVGDPILVTDARSDVILMNRRAERLFELPADAQPASARGREVQANDTKFSSVVNDLALSPDSARSAEFHLTDPETGREFPAEVVSEKILDERGESNAIVSIVHDLTKAVENERLAGELAQLNQGLEERIESATEALAERNRRLEWQSHELERAYRLKSEFLATMSHELRTPINALLGYTALLQDRIYGDLAPRQEQALARMRVATTHLLELVNDILDLAKIEAGKMPIHPERVDLAVLIRELSETFEPMVRARGLDYAVELPSELPFLETDRTRVKQVLLNLLSNAVKFTPSGSIRVRAKNVESGVEVAVVDTGIGIPEEEIGTIFEDFRQLDQTATREYGGTGLGLSITEKLLGLLGGSIRVTSRAGEGSVFTFRLPVRAPPSSAA
ncbi:MAG: ATP-binding protein, partial [Gemmatimonadota bacterium]|nr:ATP-binding protein [Gemmatimonadota bacterium]